MKPDDFNTLMEATFEEVRRLLVFKGGEYAPNEDRLENFKASAAALQADPLLIWAVYAGKHWDAIRTYVADQGRGIERQRLETIEGRFLDLMAYMTLGMALLAEGRKTEEP